VWKSWWTSWANVPNNVHNNVPNNVHNNVPNVPNKPTVSVDVKQHFNHQQKHLKPVFFEESITILFVAAGSFFSFSGMIYKTRGFLCGPAEKSQTL